MKFKSLALRLPLISWFYIMYQLSKLPKISDIEKFPSYKDVEVIANVDIEYYTTLNSPYQIGWLKRLTGLYPLVRSKDGRYFVARNLPPAGPTAKIIKARISDCIENINNGSEKNFTRIGYNWPSNW